MYVCLCHGITDRHVREAAEAGVSSLGELAALTGCGTGCGSCGEVAQNLLDEHHRYRDFPIPLLQAA